jgi:hypothetical protein
MALLQFTLAVALSALAVSAQAQLSGSLPNTMAEAAAEDAIEADEEFRAFDRDRNGYLSIQEISGSPSMVEAFRTADRNGDGYIDRREYDSLRAGSMVNRSFILSPARPADTGGSGPNAIGTQGSGR